MKFKRILAAVGIPMAALSMTSCGPEHGTVVDKNHTDEWYSTVYYPCGTNGTQMCPQVQYYPESWSLRIDEDPNDDKKPGWRSVNFGMFEACPIGSYYTYDKENKTESCSS